MSKEKVVIDTKWLKTLYSLGVGKEYLSEVKRLLREADLLNSPEWPKLCQMGYELLPDELLFESAKEDTGQTAPKDQPKSATKPTEPRPQVTNTELAKFRAMSKHPIGYKLLLARIYMELDDLAHAKPLIAEVFEADNEDYKIQARLLLQEIMTQANEAGFINIPNDIDPDLTMRYRAFADMSDRFKMLSDDEVSQRLVMAQIYLELGDGAKAKDNMAEIVQDDEYSGKASQYLKDAIADELHDISKMTNIAANAGVSLRPSQQVNKDSSGGRVMSIAQQRALVQDVSSRFQSLLGDDLPEKFAMASLYVDMHEFDLARALIADIKSRDITEYNALAEELLNKIMSDTAS